MIETEMKCFLLFLGMLVFCRVTGQDSLQLHLNDVSFPKNGCYLELGGNAVAYSINYERSVFVGEKFASSVRLGLGVDVLAFKVRNLFVPLLPIEFNLWFFKKSNHHLEVSAGITPYYSPVPESPAVATNFDLDFTSLNRRVNFLVSSRIGYRFEGGHKGWIIRVGFTPFFYDSANNYFLYHSYFGIAVGRNF
jgi:hypothetical protein